jgi:hypothetical protein
MSMQMDACLKKEQIGNPFRLDGGTKRGVWGGGALAGCPPQKLYVSSKKHPPDRHANYLGWTPLQDSVYRF